MSTRIGFHCGSIIQIASYFIHIYRDLFPKTCQRFRKPFSSETVLILITKCGKFFEPLLSTQVSCINQHSMLTSHDGVIKRKLFRVTCPFCGEFVSCIVDCLAPRFHSFREKKLIKPYCFVSPDQSPDVSWNLQFRNLLKHSASKCLMTLL